VARHLLPLRASDVAELQTGRSLVWSHGSPSELAKVKGALRPAAAATTSDEVGPGRDYGGDVVERIIGYLFASCLLVQSEPLKPQDPKPEARRPAPRCEVSIHLSPDGAVELNLREEDLLIGKRSEISCKADSILQFRTNYPEIAKRYRIERLVGDEDRLRLESGDPGDAFEKWKQSFDRRWFWDRDDAADLENTIGELSKVSRTDGLRHWIDQQRIEFEKFRHLHPASDFDRTSPGEASASGPSLEASIIPVGEALTSQLNLAKAEGVLFADVRPNGLADRSDLRKNDIALKINGLSIPDTAFLQKEVLSSTKGFTLEILRHGKLESIRVPIGK